MHSKPLTTGNDLPLHNTGRICLREQNPKRFAIIFRRPPRTTRVNSIFCPSLAVTASGEVCPPSAARERINFELIKKQGGWKSDATVWEYIDEGEQFSDNAALPLMEKMTQFMINFRKAQ